MERREFIKIVARWFRLLACKNSAAVLSLIYSLCRFARI
jgi:hypothetical protein